MLKAYYLIEFKKKKNTRPRDSNSALQLSRKVGYMCFFISFFNVLCFYLNGGVFKSSFIVRITLSRKVQSSPTSPLPTSIQPLQDQHRTETHSLQVTSLQWYAINAQGLWFSLGFPLWMFYGFLTNVQNCVFTTLYKYFHWSQDPLCCACYLFIFPSPEPPLHIELHCSVQNMASLESSASSMVTHPFPCNTRLILPLLLIPEWLISF